MCGCGNWLRNITLLDRCCGGCQWCSTQRHHSGHSEKKDRPVIYWKEILIGFIALVAGWLLRSRPAKKSEMLKAQQSVREALEEAEREAKAAAKAEHDAKDETAEANEAEIERSDRSALSSLINRVFGGTK